MTDDPFDIEDDDDEPSDLVPVGGDTDLDDGVAAPSGIGVSSSFVIATLLVLVGGGLLYADGIAPALMAGIPFAIGLLAAWIKKRGNALKSFMTGAGLISIGALVFGMIAGYTDKELGGIGTGIFCSLMFVATLVPGYVIGFGVGSAVKRLDKKRVLLGWAVLHPRAFAGAMAALPLLVAVVDNALDLPIENERVEVAREFSLPPEVLWTSSMFRGEATPKARMPFKLGLTRPKGKSGDAEKVGDEKTFIFKKGHLTIRVVETQVARKLAFKVVEQKHVEDRAARFLGGAMEFQPASAGTLARFSIDYVPLMTPRVLWRPLEHWASTAMLNDVFDRMDDSARIDRHDGGRPVAEAERP